MHFETTDHGYPKETKTANPEASFKTILPEDVDWKPFAAFPEGGRNK
jgi:hypothetical protein